MLKLNDQGNAVDLVTVTEELSAAQLLEDTGGVSYLSELAGSVPTAANIFNTMVENMKSILTLLMDLPL